MVQSIAHARLMRVKRKAYKGLAIVTRATVAILASRETQPALSIGK